MKLYDAVFPGTRGTRVKWMLEELGVPYEIAPVDVFRGEHKKPEHLARHPHGLIPAFELEGTPLIESAAICMQLADMHPDKGLAPALGTTERARWYQWILYAAATLDEPLVGWVLNVQVLPEARRRPEPVEKGKAVWAVAAPFLDRQLEGRSYILGDRFTAADVVLGYCVAIPARLGALGDHASLAAYAARLAERPAFQRAFGR